ncbi:MAG: hypothetical protein J7604_12860 [Sporocytophaga sp.]|uniref:MutS-related protein n=1 Tax=Sporocytophaga sp. TaxID=2231183 RepID=UPI001B2EE6A3|nr:hypothetical protein [Sporocytophaga sp.]MBO9701094.1 hypothetical protein [Sporocytophaga sp.]
MANPLNTFPKDVYEKQLKAFNEIKNKIEKDQSLTGTLRLCSAIAFLACLYFMFQDANALTVIGSAALLFVFIAFVIKSLNLKRKKKFYTTLIDLNQGELDGLEGDHSAFNNGVEFINPSHPYSYDLDLFGDASFFQSVNRTCLPESSFRLASILLKPLNQQQYILERQEAINVLKDKIEFRQHFYAHGSEITNEESSQKALLDWLQTSSNIVTGFIRIASIITPIICLVLIISSLFVDGLWSYIMLIVAFHWAIYGITVKKINAYHQTIGKKHNYLSGYQKVLDLIRKEDFDNASLKSYKINAEVAHLAFSKLKKLTGRFDYRLNGLFGPIMNSFFLYDFHCIYALEKWKKEHHDQVSQWLNTCEYLDALNSLAGFAFNNPRFIFPIISEGKPRVYFKSLGHPLIPESKRITNDFELGSSQNLMIVTGANMAGKSTFLRAVGLNTLLAQTGCPVCAIHGEATTLDIYSSMRTSDSLKDQTSYFHAELKRLKLIIDIARNGTPLLILIDEMLKGTNSDDKLSGSIAMVEELKDLNCASIIATHDLALGDTELKYPEKICNFCFESLIQNNDVTFDYKMRQGKATNKNATFLMKKMGIIR